MSKIAIVCDSHLPADPTSAQYAFLQRAVARMKEDRIETVLCLGDMTAFGSIAALNLYRDTLQEFTFYDVMGNAEVRDKDTVAYVEDHFKSLRFAIGSRSVYCLNTPRGTISAEDHALLTDVQDGDIVCFHHGPDRLTEESTAWLHTLCEEKALILLHGHRHMDEDRFIGKTRAIGFRGLDPDKAIGGFPAINYANISDNDVTFEEHAFPIRKETLADFRQYFGISCVDNHRDVLFAAEHSVKYIELRCNGKNWVPGEVLLPLLAKWREKTIHQTVRAEGGLKNHKPLTEWFGPMINYTSFFYHWEQEVLNHVPVFLEVRGCDNFAASVEAFEHL